MVDYKIAKVWQDSNNKYQKRPENITVQLLRDGEVYQEVQLSEDNNWQYTWNDLSSKYQWEAIEKKKTKGYIVSVSKEESSIVTKIFTGAMIFMKRQQRKNLQQRRNTKKNLQKRRQQRKNFHRQDNYGGRYHFW